MKKFKETRDRIKFLRYKEIEFVEDMPTGNDVYMKHPVYRVFKSTDDFEVAIDKLNREVKHSEKLNKEELVELVRKLSITLPHIDDTYMAYSVLAELIGGEVIAHNDREVVLMSDIVYDESDQFVETEIKYNNPYADVFVEHFNKNNIYFIIAVGEVVRIQAFIRCNALAYCNNEYDNCVELLGNVIFESHYLTAEFEKKLEEVKNAPNPFGE